MKATDTRYYIDADILGLARVLAAVRSDVTYPTFPGGKMFGRMRPPCPIASTSTDDTVWIPEIARNNWLIITRDSAIKDRRAEIAAVRDSGARMVALVGKEAVSTWQQLNIVIKRWTRIEALLAEPGPFIVAGSLSTWRRVPLETGPKTGRRRE